MKIDSLLAERLAGAGNSEKVQVIITLEHREDVEALIRKGIKPDITYESIPAVAATLAPDQIRETATIPQVKLIELDSEVTALDKRPAP